MPSSSSDSLQPYQEEVLQNTDILFTIFDFMSVKGVTDEKVISTSRKSLYSAARVCNAFKDPALTVLWSVIPSLIPLYRLLPAFHAHDGIHMLGYMEEEEWEIFDDYAKRVREIDFQIFTSSNRITELITTQLLYGRHNSTTTFPGLIGIRARTGLRIPDNVLLMLPTHNTKTIEWNDLDNPIMSALLAVLPKQTPNLRRLTLTGSSNVPLDPISRLSRLNYLHLTFPTTYINPLCLKRLATLECLETLKLHVGKASETTTPLSDHMSRTHQVDLKASQPFPALKILGVTGNPNNIARVMQHIKPWTLTHIIILEESDFHDNSSTAAASWRSILLGLACSSRLQSVVISQCAGRRRIPNPLLSLDVLASLAFLPNLAGLESLVINNGSIPARGDEDIRLQFSSKFPGLKVFKLPLSTSDTKPTLKSLLYIAQNCPRLETLRIPLQEGRATEDLKFIQEQRELSSNSLIRSRHPLRELFINGNYACGMNSRNTVLFAQFFDEQFPRLRTMLLPDGTNEQWSMIEEITLALGQKGKETIARSRQSQVLSP